MPDRSEKMICLGVLTRPHGIKGEFCLNLYADSPTLLSGPITLKKPDGTEKPCTAEGFRPHKNAWLVTIRGVNDRTQAEALAGSTLWLPRHCLPALNENEARSSLLLIAGGVLITTIGRVVIEPPGGSRTIARTPTRLSAEAGRQERHRHSDNRRAESELIDLMYHS